MTNRAPSSRRRPAVPLPRGGVAPLDSSASGRPAESWGDPAEGGVLEFRRSTRGVRCRVFCSHVQLEGL